MNISTAATNRFLSRLLLLVLLPGILFAQNSPSYQPHVLAPSLKSQAGTLLSGGNYAGAQPLLERWLEADPKDNVSWYNLACVYAVTGDKVRALDAFERSVDAGFADPNLPQRDTDLDSIRSDPRFTAAVARITERKQQEGPAGYLQRMAPMRSQGSYIVMLPPDYETSRQEYPLVLILQGSGSSEVLHGVMADRLGREGVIYAAVRAPYADISVTSSSGRAGYTAWPSETGVDGSVLRTDYVNWILDVVKAVENEFRTRKGKVYIYGHSQGGQFASLLALLHPERVASYLSQAGSAVPEDMVTTDRLTQMKGQGTSVWFVHGLQDASVPRSVSDNLAKRFGDAGIHVSLHLVPGGHTINPEMTELGKKWLTEVVLGKK